MKVLNTLLNKVLGRGTPKTDRTGIGTLSTFVERLEFDLSNNKLPIVTNKKIFFRGIVEELLWILRGSTDVTELEEKGINFWSPWKRSDGTIGKGYGYQMRKLSFASEVKPVIFEKPELIPYPDSGESKLQPAVYTSLEPTFNNMKLIGNEFLNLNGDRFTVIDSYASGVELGIHKKTSKDIVEPNWGEVSDADLWVVQFKKTGFITLATGQKILMSRDIRDNFSRSFDLVGYTGDIHKIKHTVNFSKLFNIWSRLVKDCYNPQGSGYIEMSKKGYFISEDWLNFSTFFNDVQKIPGWENFLEYPQDGYTLDCNILSHSNCFHKETTMWASQKERFINTEDYPHPYKKGYFMKYRIIDQLKNVIASIKQNPDSRRHIISLWNAHDIDEMALPPCHGALIQFYVDNGKLSCHMNQRSADLFLGVPFNISSYALFTIMMAQVTNLSPGKLHVTFGDTHVYNNLVEQVKEQAGRKVKKLPKISLNQSVKNIDKFTVDDIILDNYIHHDKIKGDVAV